MTVEKVIFQNDVVAVIERQGHIFSRQLHCDSIAVSILPYRNTDQGRQYLAKVEICPAHGPNFERGSIRAGVPRGETPRQCAQRELLHLSGYDADENSLRYMGKVRPCKSSDLVIHLFAVDVTDLPSLNVPDSSSLWLTFQQSLQVSDPIFITAITRLECA